MPVITCPGCGTDRDIEQLHRDASEFCATCDYPLFWARTALPGGDESSDVESGLRRLPGTAGRVLAATLPCWSCDEPNLVTAVHCIRCGADLHPVAVEPTIIVAPLPPPPPEPEPEVEPPHRPWWPWIVAAMVLIAVIVLLIVLPN